MGSGTTQPPCTLPLRRPSSFDSYLQTALSLPRRGARERENRCSPAFVEPARVKRVQ